MPPEPKFHSRQARRAGGTVSVEVYLTPEDREVIRQAAESERKSMSQLLASSGLLAAKKILKKMEPLT